MCEFGGAMEMLALLEVVSRDFSIDKTYMRLQVRSAATRDVPGLSMSLIWVLLCSGPLKYSVQLR